MRARHVIAINAALAGPVVVASVAHAGTVRLTTPVAERSHLFGGTPAHEYGYVGPPTTDWPGRDATAHVHVGGLLAASAARRDKPTR